MATDRPKINIVVGEKFSSFTEFERWNSSKKVTLSFVQLYKRSSIKTKERDNKQRTCVPCTHMEEEILHLNLSDLVCLWFCIRWCRVPLSNKIYKRYSILRVPGFNIHRKQSTGFAAENVTKSDFIRELVHEIIREQNTSYMHAFYSTIRIFNKKY